MLHLEKHVTSSYQIFNRIRKNFSRGLPSNFLTDLSEIARQKQCPNLASPSKQFLTDSLIGQKFGRNIILKENQSVKKIVEIMLMRCQFVKKYSREYFDGMSVRQKRSVKNFDGSVKKYISTMLFLTDILSDKMAVKNFTIRPKVNFYPSKIPSKKITAFML